MFQVDRGTIFYFLAKMKLCEAIIFISFIKFCWQFWGFLLFENFFLILMHHFTGCEAMF